MDSRFGGHGNKVSISWGKPEKSSDSKVPLKGRDIRSNFQEGTIWDLFSFASLSCKNSGGDCCWKFCHRKACARIS